MRSRGRYRRMALGSDLMVSRSMENYVYRVLHTHTSRDTGVNLKASMNAFHFCQGILQHCHFFLHTGRLPNDSLIVGLCPWHAASAEKTGSRVAVNMPRIETRTCVHFFLKPHRHIRCEKCLSPLRFWTHSKSLKKTAWQQFGSLACFMNGFAYVRLLCGDSLNATCLALKTVRRMQLTHRSELIPLSTNTGPAIRVAAMARHTSIFWSWRGTSDW
jgi:hypothetical protein